MSKKTKVGLAKKWLKGIDIPDISNWSSESTIAVNTIDDETLKEILDKTNSFELCAKIWHFALNEDLKLDALRKIEKIINNSPLKKILAIHKYCIDHDLYKKTDHMEEGTPSIRGAVDTTLEKMETTLREIREEIKKKR